MKLLVLLSKTFGILLYFKDIYANLTIINIHLPSTSLFMQECRLEEHGEGRKQNVQKQCVYHAVERKKECT